MRFKVSSSGRNISLIFIEFFPLKIMRSGRQVISGVKREDHLICTHSSVMNWNLLDMDLPAWISLIPGAFLGAVWQVCLRGGMCSITALMALSVFR